jgi:hypothetical protein
MHERAWQRYIGSLLIFMSNTGWSKDNFGHLI